MPLLWRDRSRTPDPNVTRADIGTALHERKASSAPVDQCLPKCGSGCYWAVGKLWRFKLINGVCTCHKDAALGIGTKTSLGVEDAAFLLDFSAILPSINRMPITAFEVAEMPTAKAVEVIRAGLPARAFVGVAIALSLTVDELAAKLGVSPRTIRDQRKKLARLSSENTEKLVRIARIQHQARKIFSTDEAVSDWLMSPAPALEGAKPIDLLDTGLGAREIEAVLNGIAYGNVM